MNDYGDPQRVERATRKLGSMSSGRWRECIAVHVREVDAPPLDDLSVGDDASQPAASTSAFPRVLGQLRGRVLVQERSQDSILQLPQPLPDTMRTRVHGRISSESSGHRGHR